MSLLKVNEIQIFNGETVTITAPAVVTANDNTNAALRITQTGSGNALVVEDSANPDSTPFVVNNVGRVGIGTSNVNRLLHVKADTDSGTGGIIENVSAGPSAYTNLIVRNDSNKRVEIGIQSSTRTTTYPANEGWIYVSDALNLGYNGATKLYAGTTERMRIDSSGNVGIAVTNPTQKLDVDGNINASGALTLGTALAVAEGGTGVTALSSLDAADLGSSTATDGYVLTADGSGGAAWEAASGGGGGTAAYVEHSSTISDSFTITSGTNRMYIGGTTFSGTISVAGRLAIVAGPANFTGTINTTGTLTIME